MDLNYEILQFYAYKKIIKRKQIKEIYADCTRLNMAIENYMIAKGYCTQVTALAALGEFFCMPYCEMGMLEVDKTLLENTTYTFLRKHKIVPVSVDKNGLMLFAVARPLDMSAMSMVYQIYSGPVDFILVPSVQIDIFIDSIVAVESTANALQDLQEKQDKELVNSAQKNELNQIEKNDDVINNPSVRLVDSIIREAIPFRASDIHIEPFEKAVKVRYRIDGDLQMRAEFPIESYPAICARLKILSGISIAERRIPQDGRISMTINGTEYDFRVSTLPTVYGEKFVIRILDKTAFNFTRTELGFTEEENTIIDKILAHSYGIVLLTGPTGCGKSTTLYSFLKEINRPEVNVITVEDPVEYTMPGINQVQVNTKASLTFANALRSILRQDPDIIMLGEIRDEETAEIAIRAAITGHLVFSTLHTNDAPGAITRLEDMKVTDYLVADAVVGIIAQRLVKRLCPACKKRGRANESEMKILGIDEPVSIFRPQGCQYCNNTGYKGRIAVHEIMYMTDKIKSAMSAGSPGEKIRELAEADGMVNLWDSCKELVYKGVTDITELMTIYGE
ncbi:MAG: GspE/PulE family protein [Clostridia bacterium]|nr:GspE/PulE family protein [Clostridia bacterium]